LALTPGTRLGVYEVLAQIGEGGIKILPPSVAAEHDRLARFQREAHPALKK
jgi:hypothetical protein